MLPRRIRAGSTKGPNLPNDPLDELYRRPGFMIRRAHQIAVALFLEETGELKITTTQYGILCILERRPGIDQISVAKLLGLDRSTAGMVVNKLVEAGLVGRSTVARDRRRVSLHLTGTGARMLTRLAGPAERARARVLSPLPPRERASFLDMLDKLVRSFNGSTRVPLSDDRGQTTDDGTSGGVPAAAIRRRSRPAARGRESAVRRRAARRPGRGKDPA
jgi:DNA-binding MarR family transcriptional regulator